MTTAELNQLEEMVARVKKAQAEYADFPQDKVDSIFRKAAIAANVARIDLAKKAVAETGMGIVEDKVTKNHFASEFIYNTSNVRIAIDKFRHHILRTHSFRNIHNFKK